MDRQERVSSEGQSEGPKASLKGLLENAIHDMVARGIYWPEALAEFEKLFIESVLRKHKGNLSRAADEMGVHRNTLSKKIREYEIRCKGKVG